MNAPAIDFGEGLLPVVVQDRLTGQVRMLAWANRAALEATIASGRATFWSRSRNELWEKGATSGNGLVVRAIATDCDADALLYLCDPEGPTCHTGAPSCFFRRVNRDGATEEARDAAAFLEELERTIEARRASTSDKSYTRALLDGGAPKIGAKLREEADELARAIEGETVERVASEAADVLFHAMVGLASRGVRVRDVLAELARRAGTSGHDEKARRG